MCPDAYSTICVDPTIACISPCSHSSSLEASCLCRNGQGRPPRDEKKYTRLSGNHRVEDDETVRREVSLIRYRAQHHTATIITDAIARTVLGERKMWTKKEEIWARRLGAKRALSSRSAVASIKTIPTTTTANGHKTCPHTHQRQGMSH